MSSSGQRDEEDRDAIGVRVVNRIADVSADQWDACANPLTADTLATYGAAEGRVREPAQTETYNPFVSHAFLNSLEASDTVAAETGWLPQHLLVEEGDGTVSAAMPCYLKSHSFGEYVFDHGWADAYERAGGRSYPKLQVSVPFTPVPGPRLLARPGPKADAPPQAPRPAATPPCTRHRDRSDPLASPPRPPRA